jgi:murein DD-endopeptidase MepM/ murein hydrolase activator NlpD
MKYLRTVPRRPVAQPVGRTRNGIRRGRKTGTRPRGRPLTRTSVRKGAGVVRWVVIATLALLTAASGPTAAQPGPASRPAWLWPLSPRPMLGRHFEPPPQPWMSGHRGVDLLATPGSHVRAPTAGRIVFAGWVVDRPVLTLAQAGGTLSSFEPVSSSLAVGTSVTAGQVLGTVVMNRHCPPSSCLHWGVRRTGVYVDPLQFIVDRRPSILLPLVPP